MTWRMWATVDPSDLPEHSGYVVAPPRPPWLTFLLFWVVVATASTVAHVFRDATELVVEWYSGSPDQLAAASSLRWLVVTGVVAAAVFGAALLGRLVERRWAWGSGIEAVAASARGEGGRISVRASALRASGTWLAATGLSSIGRESAIIEIGGAFGTVVGRRSGGRGDVLATAGIAAAFAAAYHSPIAAVLYVEEHLRVSSSRRALWFATTAALAAYVFSIRVFGGRAIFPTPEGPRWETLGLALFVVVPAAVAARVFRRARVRVKAVALAERLPVPWWSVVAVFALVAGVGVAAFPLASGNGMETLREAAGGPTLAIALALGVGKLIATTASLGSGAPGGALTPTMSIAGGFALLSVLGIEGLGVNPTPGVVWGAMVAAMAVGVAVGLRSPLLAIVLVPELVGDYTLLPLIAVVVVAATIVDRGLDRVVRRFGPLVPDVVYDDDA